MTASKWRYNKINRRRTRSRYHVTVCKWHDVAKSASASHDEWHNAMWEMSASEWQKRTVGWCPHIIHMCVLFYFVSKDAHYKFRPRILLSRIYIYTYKIFKCVHTFRYYTLLVLNLIRFLSHSPRGLNFASFFAAYIWTCHKDTTVQWFDVILTFCKVGAKNMNFRFSTMDPVLENKHTKVLENVIRNFCIKNTYRILWKINRRCYASLCQNDDFETMSIQNIS